MTPPAIRLIASDLDNTLLTSAKTISLRTRAAVAAAQAAGLVFVAATGRQLATMPPDLPELGLRYAVASNGAVGFDYLSQQPLFVDLLPAEVQRQIMEFLLESAPGTVFGAGRGLGEVFVAQPEYVAMTTQLERIHDQREYVYADASTVCSEPTIKLVARNEQLGVEALYALLESSGLSGFQATTSGAVFLEIGAAGVTKAKGLSQIAALLEIPAAQIAAVGDAMNDAEMLRWAGLGVAVSNAEPEALAAASKVIGSNDEDGLAQFIETLLAELPGHSGPPARTT